MSWLRRLGALVVLLALLVGVPWGLWTWGSLALPAGVGDAPWWALRDDGTLFLSGLTLLGWLAWACFAVATLAEAVGMVTGHRWQLPGLRWAQLLAGGLLVAIVATSASAALAPAPAHADPPPVGVTAVQPAVVQPGAGSVGPAGGSGAAVPGAAVPDADAGALAAPDGVGARAPQRTHVVQPGDDLWSIAVAQLGDGFAWRTIFELNTDVIADPDHLEPGWVLRLPGLPNTGGPGPAVALPAAPEVVAAEVAQTAAPEAAATTPAPPASTDVPAPVPAAPSAPTAEPSAVSAGQTAAVPSGSPAQTGTAVSLGPDANLEAAPFAVGMGAFAAAAVLGLVGTRRAARASSREIGRRFPNPAPASSRLEAVLASRVRPVTPDDLALVQRVVAERCRDASLPRLDHVRLDADGIDLVFDGPAGVAVPIGMVATERGWRVPASGLPYLRADDDTPRAWPALVCVGSGPDGDVLVDLAGAGRLQVSDPDILRALTAVCLSTPGLDVVAPAGEHLVTSFDVPGGHVAADADEVISLLGLGARGDVPLEQRRQAQLDVDLADAHRPRLALWPVTEPRLDAAVDVGLVLVSPAHSPWRLDDAGLHTPAGTVALTPARLAADEARDLGELVVAASDPTTEPAWWWAADADVASVTWLRPRPLSSLLVPPAPEAVVTDPPLPTLGLLGPLELRGTRGTPPPRALKQCIEYAAWLMEHPNATASQMCAALLVAEGTRRSNMSRLRTWLGCDDDGEPFLPEAYSGRIRLSSDVGSDWHRLQLIVGPGINRVSPDSLAAALGLVRGAPLADAAPGQWIWAEPMRSDMVALIRDVAAQLARLALEAGDLDLVRWATARGFVAAPGDEVLTVLRIRAEHMAGNDVEVERLVNRMARHARTLGVDLAEETVAALQEVIEGQTRAHRIPQGS